MQAVTMLSKDISQRSRQSQQDRRVHCASSTEKQIRNPACKLRNTTERKQDIPIKRRVRPQIQTSQTRHNDTTNEMRLKRHIQPRMNLGQKPRKRHALIPRKAPTKPALPRMTRDLAANARGNNHTLEDDGAGLTAQGLVEQLEDRHVSRGGEEGVQVIETEEHADGVEPSGDEADGDGAHDGDGDHAFGAVDLFGHVGGAIQTGKGPVGVDEADDEGDAVGGPARVVDEVGEDEFGGLVGGGFGGDDDHDDEEGDERGVEGEGGDGGEESAVAVEDEGEGVDALVGDEDVPGEDGAGIGLVRFPMG